MKFCTKSLPFCLLVLSMFLIQCTSDKNKIHKQLKSEIDGINEKCPMQISNSIRIDSCVLLPNNDMEYFYTVTDSVSYTTAQFNEIQEEVTSATKNNPQMKYMRDNKISTRYTYRDFKGDVAFIFQVTPKDYK